MSKFVIQPHGRLHEWIAIENGYFEDEGLDYHFDTNRRPALWQGSVASAEAPRETRRGAYESYAEGRDSNVSCACHWTVNVAAANQHGRLWGECYSVSPSGIFVAPDSPYERPEDLAGVEVIVGYHSGSHYSTVQGLEPFLKPEEINLRFGGLLYDRMDLLVDGTAEAVNAFGAPYYVLEQLGFRKLVDSTFMIAAMITGDADLDDVQKYFRALRRAQHDIDLKHQDYTHYYLRELPERYHDMIDVRRFGPGERIVFEPYSKEIFEETHNWIAERDFFPDDEMGQGRYEDAVIRV